MCFYRCDAKKDLVILQSLLISKVLITLFLVVAKGESKAVPSLQSYISIDKTLEHLERCYVVAIVLDQCKLRGSQKCFFVAHTKSVESIARFGESNKRRNSLKHIRHPKNSCIYKKIYIFKNRNMSKMIYKVFDVPVDMEFLSFRWKVFHMLCS